MKNEEIVKKVNARIAAGHSLDSVKDYLLQLGEELPDYDDIVKDMDENQKPENQKANYMILGFVLILIGIVAIATMPDLFSREATFLTFIVKPIIGIDSLLIGLIFIFRRRKVSSRLLLIIFYIQLFFLLLLSLIAAKFA